MAERDLGVRRAVDFRPLRLWRGLGRRLGRQAVRARRFPSPGTLLFLKLEIWHFGYWNFGPSFYLHLTSITTFASVEQTEGHYARFQKNARFFFTPHPSIYVTSPCHLIETACDLSGRSISCGCGFINQSSCKYPNDGRRYSEPRL